MNKGIKLILLFRILTLSLFLISPGYVYSSEGYATPTEFKVTIKKIEALQMMEVPIQLYLKEVKSIISVHAILMRY